MTRALESWLRVEQTAFCPGCGHGILLGAVVRACDELGLDRRRLLFVSGIGCAAWIPSPHIAADSLHTLHGRAVAYATGAKLVQPEMTTLVVSGDGDLSSIGGNHLIHAARRDIDLTVICGNNQIYGMTGGQTASTTPVGALSATDPRGNRYRPFDLCAVVMAAGARYAARWPVTRPRPLTDSIKRGIRTPGFAFIEAISPCPTQFGRRNRYEDLTRLYDAVDERCLPREEALRMSPEQIEGRYLVGEYD
ncbi:MAG: 2-oxoacid:ferredoxin oxidoreductase subunit beta [Deltaproteobacteria bacterium]|nr:2-oxoacid:ferredoxin oxidoreductase subunit beta [Deltaproteobacteria bacterium]